jgi:hypothetical protein
MTPPGLYSLVLSALPIAPAVLELEWPLLSIERCVGVKGIDVDKEIRLSFPSRHVPLDVALSISPRSKSPMPLCPH